MRGNSVASLAAFSLNAKQKAEIEQAADVLADIVAVEEQEIADWGNRRNDNMVELPSYQS